MPPAEQNIIQVVIESVNKMSQDLKQIEGDMRKLEGTTGTTAKTMRTAATSTRGMMNVMSPLRTLLVQLTGVTGGFGTAIFNLVRFGFSPLGLALTATTVAISAVISKWIEGKRESGEFRKFINAQTLELSTLNLQYRLLVGSITKSGAASEQAKKQMADQLNSMAEGVDTLRSKIEALDKTSRAFGADPKNPIAQFFRGLIGLSEEDLRRKEEERSVTEGLVDAKARQSKKIIDAGDELNRKQKVWQAEAESLLKEEQEEFFTYRDIQRALVQTDQEAFEERLKLQEEFNKKHSQELQKAEDQDNAELQRRAEDVFKLTQKAHEEAERAAEDYAKTFADRLVSAMEGEKMDIQGIFRSIGRVAMVGLIEEITKMAILGPLKDIFASDALSGGKQSKGGLFGGIFKSIFGLIGLGGLGSVPEYGKGGYLSGNFMPIGPLRKFATGGIASGPTLGVIGEEGPEIVARMKPARSGDGDGEGIKQNIYLVDARPPRLGPRDVVLYIEADMRSGGPTARAVQNVIKRT